MPTRAVYERPGFFKGSTATIYGTNETIPYPDITEQLDYELEIGYVIGKPGRNVTPEDAFDHVFGITIFNDWSMRDVQVLESPIGMGAQHSKDFAYGIGPWIVTMDEIPSIIGLTGQVRVNGEVLVRHEGRGLHLDAGGDWSPTSRSSTAFSRATSSARARWPSAPAWSCRNSCSRATCSSSNSSASGCCAPRSRPRRSPPLVADAAALPVRGGLSLTSSGTPGPPHRDRSRRSRARRHPRRDARPEHVPLGDDPWVRRHRTRGSPTRGPSTTSPTRTPRRRSRRDRLPRGRARPSFRIADFPPDSAYPQNAADAIFDEIDGHDEAQAGARHGRQALLVPPHRLHRLRDRARRGDHPARRRGRGDAQRRVTSRSSAPPPRLVQPH